MKYEDYEGSVEGLILQKIKEIEKKENIKVLHAIESGSRAWGFASPDSDYDVRFIYIREEDYYLSLCQTKDFIDWELNEVLDINGWDLKKALQQFHKSNATLFEWSNSPVVYYTTDEWRELYNRIGNKYFSCKSALYHYYGTANKNYHEYLMEDMVKYKKYFYVLRPILACKWIEERHCPPPVLFDELLNAVLEDAMKPAVEDLLAKKVKMSEADKAPKVDVINQYIEKKLSYYKELVESMDDDRNSDWEPLEAEFRRLLRGSNTDFWRTLDELVRQSKIIIDRPKGTAHPKFPNFIYKVDYGYLENTSSMDGAGIDVWVGTKESKTIDAIMCIVDLMKKDSEIKILIGCTEEEKEIIYKTHNETQYMKGILIER